MLFFLDSSGCLCNGGTLTLHSSIGVLPRKVPARGEGKPLVLIVICIVIIPSSFSWNVCVCVCFFKYRKKRKNHARTQNCRFFLQKKGMVALWHWKRMAQTFLWFANSCTITSSHEVYEGKACREACNKRRGHVVCEKRMGKIRSRQCNGVGLFWYVYKMFVIVKTHIYGNTWMITGN